MIDARRVKAALQMRLNKTDENDTEGLAQELVLFAHRPGARKGELLAPPQHGFEPPDRASCRVKGLKATDPRHGSFDPEMIALDPLL